MKAIVCVDDEALITQVLTFQLSKHFDPSMVLIESVNEPMSFFQLADDLKSLGLDICLVIVDFQMPKMNGAELIRQIKQNDKTIKFIMLSGQANAIVVEELRQEGLVHAFIHKPWDEDEIVRLVKSFID